MERNDERSRVPVNSENLFLFTEGRGRRSSIYVILSFTRPFLLASEGNLKPFCRFLRRFYFSNKFSIFFHLYDSFRLVYVIASVIKKKVLEFFNVRCG